MVLESAGIFDVPDRRQFNGILWLRLRSVLRGDCEVVEGEDARMSTAFSGSQRGRVSQDFVTTTLAHTRAPAQADS